MKYIIYDIEYTAWEGSLQRNWSFDFEEQEVIQIGAVMIEFDTIDLQIISTFNEFVKPTINPNLSNYISNLTGIYQTHMDHHGLDLNDALSKFEVFCDCGSLCTFSWGNDANLVRKNAKLVGIEFPMFLENTIDISARLPAAIGKYDLTVSSGTLHQSVGLNLKLRNHDALDDSKSIFETLRSLHKQGKLDLGSVFR